MFTVEKKLDLDRGGCGLVPPAATPLCAVSAPDRTLHALVELLTPSRLLGLPEFLKNSKFNVFMGKKIDII